MPELVALLQDAVHSGASIGFLAPLAATPAAAFWNEIFDDVGRDARILLVARCGGQIAGSVHLGLCTKANGIHRAELQKLLVHTRWRRQGLAKALMAAAEEEARLAGRSLLYLDTEIGKPAELLYQQLGWTRAGEIPDYATTPEGILHPTVIYFRRV